MKRLDEAMVDRGLVKSRSRAKMLIEEGKVMVGGELVKKSSKKVGKADEVRLLEEARFVSRAGEKLEGYLETTDVQIEGKVCLDIGASTGGFTDCLLQRGAKHVSCVDVGHGQLHGKIAWDKRVRNIEGVNAKDLMEEELPYPSYEVVVIDVSFISLRKVLPSVWGLVADGGELVALVKPQFEAGREVMKGTKGILKDEEARMKVMEEVKGFIEEELEGAKILGEGESAILGGDGNVEYLLRVLKTLP